MLVGSLSFPGFFPFLSLVHRHICVTVCVCLRMPKSDIFEESCTLKKFDRTFDTRTSRHLEIIYVHRFSSFAFLVHAYALTYIVHILASICGISLEKTINQDPSPP